VHGCNISACRSDEILYIPFTGRCVVQKPHANDETKRGPCGV
jgi:hypothetical protein